jgi:hypothetical protein
VSAVPGWQASISLQQPWAQLVASHVPPPPAPPAPPLAPAPTDSPSSDERPQAAKPKSSVTTVASLAHAPRELGCMLIAFTHD